VTLRPLGEAQLTERPRRRHLRTPPGDCARRAHRRASDRAERQRMPTVRTRWIRKRPPTRLQEPNVAIVTGHDEATSPR
jgi:hypothetical protein